MKCMCTHEKEVIEDIIQILENEVRVLPTDSAMTVLLMCVDKIKLYQENKENAGTDNHE